MGVLAAIEARLEDDWAVAYKYASVQVTTGAALITTIWQTVPDDLKAQLPSWISTAFAYAAFAAIIIARVMKKPSTDA